jgi:DNA-binding IclR family transcriptional regulator
LKKAKPKAASDGGVAAVDRALSILSAFQANDAALGLAELAARTRINKSTILRLTQSLIHGRLLLRLDDGRFRLGSETLRLGSLYQQGHSVGEILLPRMQALGRSTGESVVFHVREGDARVCLIRVESDQPIRYHVREGEVMPLNLGSCGRVLLAFSNAAGEPY